MPPPSDPRNLRAKWQRALEERRKAGAATPPLDVTPRPDAARKTATPAAARRAAAGEETAASEAPRRKAQARVETPPSEEARATERQALKEAARKPPALKEAAPKEAAPDTPPPAGNAAREDEKEAAAKKATAPTPLWGTLLGALAVVAGIALAARTLIRPDEAPPPAAGEESPAASGAASAATLEPAAPLEPPRPVQPARCSEAAKESFMIGDAPQSPKPATTASDGDDSPEEDLAPFAVELGRGVKIANGFAVGSQRQAEGGTVSMVATVGEDGSGGKLVRLSRSRGDLDPPVVAAAGSALLAAVMEPNAGGRAIRIAKVEGERVTWGPELSEGRDESFAVDLAAAGQRALVVWDDVPLGHERSVIELATFDVETMRGSGARAITPSTIDADVPQLAKRPGGYWLAYMVHGEPPTAPTAAEDDGPDDGGAKKKTGKGAETNLDDSDYQAAGEAIAHQWLELLPLDEAGMSVGAARAVTPKDSRVIGYDLDAGEDGRAMLLYREDDTPNGSNGGRVKVVTAELGGVGEPRVITEEGVGAGVPQLHGGWVVIHSLSGPVQLGAMSPSGDLVGALAPEALLRNGEILAAGGQGALLVATPAGRAMKLSVVRCSR